MRALMYVGKDGKLYATKKEAGNDYKATQLVDVPESKAKYDPERIGKWKARKQMGII